MVRCFAAIVLQLPERRERLEEITKNLLLTRMTIVGRRHADIQGVIRKVGKS